MGSGGKGASPGDLSLLFHIVKVVALVLFRSQDDALPFDKSRLIGKLSMQLYRQMHILSLDCMRQSDTMVCKVINTKKKTLKSVSDK